MKDYYLVSLSNLLVAPARKSGDFYGVTSDLKFINNEYVVILIDREYKLINIATKEVVLNENVRFVINDIAVLMDGRLYDITNRSFVDTSVFKYAFHEGDIISLTFNFEYNNLYYNSKTKQFIPFYNGRVKKHELGDNISLRKDGKYAMVQSNNTSELWDLENGKILRTFRGAAELFNDYILTEDEKIIRLKTLKPVEGLDALRTSVVGDYILYEGNVTKVFNADTMDVISTNRRRNNEKINIVNDYLIVNKTDGKGSSYIESLKTGLKKNFLNKKIVPLNNKYIGIYSKNRSIKIYDIENDLFVAKFPDIVCAETFGDLIVLTESNDRKCFVYNPRTDEQTEIKCSGMDAIQTDDNVVMFTRDCEIRYIHAPQVVENYANLSINDNKIVTLYETKELDKDENVLKRTK